MEEWKQITDYPDYYISNLGRVKSMKRGKEKILKPGISREYYVINLCQGGKVKKWFLHRLVGEAFLENPNNYPIINHKNQIKTDNRVENLEFCTQKYNVNYGDAIQRRSKPVLQFNKSGNLIHEWPSMSEVERQLGFYQSNISKCCSGKLKTANNYIWKYK